MFPLVKIARQISAIENRVPGAFEDLASVYHAKSLSRTICLTGPGGVGKSSLLAELVALVANKNKTIAWLACDPSSPVTGGSLLGDRIRLAGAEISEKVYIRSLSTRSTLAFSRAVRDIAIYLESQFDYVVIETAGAGQTQSEISQLAPATLLVLQPETGDEVQWMKSGLRECADLFIVNKSDLSGAEEMQQSLVDLGTPENRIFLVSSKKKKGLDDLWSSVVEFLSSEDSQKKLESIHQDLAQSLYQEAAVIEFQKTYQALRAQWEKNPYAELLKKLGA
jgi:LAO/AO transport system kinase